MSQSQTLAKATKKVLHKLPRVELQPINIASTNTTPPAPTPRLAEISFQLRSSKQGPWTLGDLLEYTIHVKNVSGTARGFTPVDGNLTNWQKCKWSTPFPDQTTKSDCNFVTHRITAEDVSRGYFEPFITYDGVPKVVGDKVIIRPEAIALELGNVTGIKPHYAVGDVLSFPVKVISRGQENYTLRTDTSNLTFTGAKCDGPLNMGSTHSCEIGTYTITENDLEAGSFTPTLTVTALSTNQEVAGVVTLKATAVNLPPPTHLAKSKRI